MPPMEMRHHTEAKVIRHGYNKVPSALISENTKLTFRSRSAWLVQMSSEMWDFASPYEAVDNQTNHEFNKDEIITSINSLIRDELIMPSVAKLVQNETVGLFCCDICFCCPRG